MTLTTSQWNKASNRNRKLVALVTAVLLASTPAAGILPGGGTASAAETMLNVIPRPFVIDGVRTTVPTAIVDGETYISLRALNEKLGLATSWDAKARTAIVFGRNRVFIASPDKGTYELNGQPVYGSMSILSNGSTYIPLRFLLERMGYMISYDAPTRTIGIQTIEENKLTIASKTISEVNESQSLVIHYPVISGYKNEEAEDKVNAYLKKEAESFAVSAQESLTKAIQDNNKWQAENPGADYPPVAYEATYTITYNENDHLSLYVDYNIDLGGAHGSTIRVPYTFDLSTGETVSLKQAANNNANYVSIINKNMNDQIKARKLDLIAPFEGIKADRPYYLRHGAIVITFEQYEYTAYALGMPEFAIPLKVFE